MSITLNGSTSILSGATYDPFGPSTGWSWGNGSTVTRQFDEDANPSQIVTAGVTNGYMVDAASRITEISDSGLSSNTWNFPAYDNLDRIKTASSSAKSRGYTYDANGNRLTTTGSTGSTETISTTNNQITSTTGNPARTYGYDLAGNTTSYTGEAFTFNQRGRVSAAESSVGTTYYVYNALGELIEKSGTGGTTLLVYDESGHLLGEYTSAGVIVQETIWMGDLPVATLRPSGSTVAVYYVHTDHLGAVRKVTRPSDNGLMWRWDPDTFGSSTSSPDQNPSGLGTFTYNLRFPGQYYLSESGLFYNYYRTYDPAMGRYIEADPTGLKGGINPYAYVSNNPLWYIDRFGLTQCDINVARRIAAATQTDLTFPDSYGSFDLGLDDRGNRIAARTIPGTGTILSDYYQQVLTNAQAGELLDTIIHEAVHFTLPANDPRQDDNSGQGYAYSEALKRTTKALKSRFNKERMDCPCEANQAP